MGHGDSLQGSKGRRLETVTSYPPVARATPQVFVSSHFYRFTASFHSFLPFFRAKAGEARAAPEGRAAALRWIEPASIHRGASMLIDGSLKRE
jgi:hypothetical protein